MSFLRWWNCFYGVGDDGHINQGRVVVVGMVVVVMSLADRLLSVMLMMGVVLVMMSLEVLMVMTV